MGRTCRKVSEMARRLLVCDRIEMVRAIRITRSTRSARSEPEPSALTLSEEVAAAASHVATCSTTPARELTVSRPSMMCHPSVT
eukprot:scaffold24990_cov63-Phaeocystis_antarctica.AAC.6